MAETGKQAGGTLLGLLGSSLIATGIDKIPFMAVKETDGKVVSILKKAAKPVLLIGAGGTVSVMGRKHGKKFVASIGDGIAVGGGFSAIKAIAGSKTTIFNGLGSSETEVLSATANYYQENLQALENAMKENAKLIELKGVYEAELSGKVTIPGTQLNNEASSNIL